MDFRELLTKLEVLSEAVTLQDITTALKGYENSPAVKNQILADIAKKNNLPGLFDPISGKFIDIDGDEDEIEDTAIEQLSKLGLIPQNADLGSGGIFDTDVVTKGYQQSMRSQSADINAKQVDAKSTNEKLTKLAELVKQYVELKQKSSHASLAESKFSKQLIESFGYLIEADPGIADGEWRDIPPTTEPKQLGGSAKPKGLLTKISSKMGIPLAAAYEIWDGYDRITNLPTTLTKDQYHKEVTRIVGQLVADFGLTVVGGSIGAFIGSVGGPIGSIVGGIGGAVGASFAFGDNTDELVNWIVDKLYKPSSTAGQPQNEPTTPTNSPVNANPVPVTADTHTTSSNYDPNVAKIQQYLKSQGANLGSTGPNRDGIDGVMGNLTKTAMNTYGDGSARSTQLIELKTQIDSLVQELSKSYDPNVKQQLSTITHQLDSVIHEGLGSAIAKWGIKKAAQNFGKTSGFGKAKPFKPEVTPNTPSNIPPKQGDYMPGGPKNTPANRVPNEPIDGEFTGTKVATQQPKQGDYIPGGPKNTPVTQAQKDAIEGEFKKINPQSAEVKSATQRAASDPKLDAADKEAIQKGGILQWLKKYPFKAAALGYFGSVGLSHLDDQLGNSAQGGSGIPSSPDIPSMPNLGDYDTSTERHPMDFDKEYPTGPDISKMSKVDMTPPPKKSPTKPTQGTAKPKVARGNPEVIKWQQLLNANGANLKVDGVYSPEMKAAYDKIFPSYQRESTEIDRIKKLSGL